MSKGAQTAMAKAESLANGMRKNIEKVRTLGIDTDYIARLEEEVAALAATDRAVEEAAATLSELRRKNNEAMSRLNEDVLTAKKSIKAKYDKMEWLDFGIADKQ